jgi:Tfp pilus assembly protein PilO
VNSLPIQEILEKINGISFGRMLFGGLIIGVLYYYAIFDDSSAMDPMIVAAREELAKESGRLASVESIISNKARFESEVKQISETFDKALEFLPKDLNMSDLTKKITTEAKASGAQVISIKPQPERNRHEFYEELLIDLELRGTFAEVTMFLSFISKIPRIIKVQTVKMSKNAVNSDGSVEILFSGRLAAYRYVGVVEEKTGEGDLGE